MQLPPALTKRRLGLAQLPLRDLKCPAQLHELGCSGSSRGIMTLS